MRKTTKLYKNYIKMPGNWADTLLPSSTNFANPKAGQPATYLHTVLRDLKSSGQKTNSGMYVLSTTATGPVAWFVSLPFTITLLLSSDGHARCPTEGDWSLANPRFNLRPRLLQRRRPHILIDIPICSGSSQPIGLSLKTQTINCRIRGAASMWQTFRKQRGWRTRSLRITST